VVLRADEARKRRFGVAPETRLPPEAYAETASRIVLAGLMADAATALHLGQSVILDTTFLDPQDRAAARSATGEADFRAVWLQAPLDVLEARVGGRQGDASDATIDVLRRAAEKPGPTDWPVLATDDPAALDRFVDELTQPIASC
jgi:predicted kinase